MQCTEEWNRPPPMVSEAELLSQLIGVIYDAALDTALWSDVLRQCCDFVGGVSANLFAQDAARANVQTFYTWGDNPDYTRLYHEKYLTLNPVFPVGMFIPVGEVLCQADILPHDEMRQTRFYKEWMQPQGIIDFVGCNLEKSATSAAAFAIMRTEQNGYVDDETRRRMALIAPHVRRAVLIGKVIDLQKVEAAMMADTLDGLAAAMFLVDAGARIVHANAAGRTMIAGGQVLRAPSGRSMVPRTRRCRRRSRQPAAATVRSAISASPCRYRHRTANSMSPMCCR